MKRLQHLYDHLKSFIAPEKLKLFVDGGEVISYPSEDQDNDKYQQDFLLRGKIMLLVMDYTGDVHFLVYTVNKWLNKHDPRHASNAVTFETELRENGSFDIALKFLLSESVDVTLEGSGNVKLELVPLPGVDSPETIVSIIDQKTGEIKS